MDDHPAAKPDPIPLVLGVTGHRDLRPEDLDALGARVGEILGELRTRYPNTPLVLISSLAEGADRLVARRVSASGGRLIVPLPMPPDEYSKDFQDPASRAEFDAFLSGAVRSFVLDSVPGVVGETDGTSREQKYAMAGAYVARNCQVLIALWDGVDAGRVGGTSEVVKFRLEGETRHYRVDRSPLDPPEAGPVYTILTPRRGKPLPGGEPFSVKRSYPRTADGLNEMPASIYDEVFRRIDQFNADSVRYSGRLGADHRRSRGYLFSPEEYEALGPSLRARVERFATADTLANLFRLRSKVALIVLLALIFVTTISFQYYVLVRKMTPGMTHNWRALSAYRSAWVYAASLTAACVWYFVAKRLDFRNKYLDYRALAEALRVEIYWKLAGTKLVVVDQYLRKQRGVLDWIRDALRTGDVLDGHPPGAAVPPAPGAPPIALIRDRWVKDQETFFLNRVRKDATWGWVLGRVSTIFLAIGIGVSLLRIFYAPNDQMIVELAVIMAVPAMINGYARTMALSEQLKQYRRMKLIFSIARQSLERLDGAGDGKTIDRVLGDLGREALAENGDWVMLHRERPLPTPV